MKLVAQMDDIASINIKGDSTFAILFEAQNRGHDIFYYLPSNLSYDFKKRKLSALVKKLKLKKQVGDHFEILDESYQDLGGFDVLLVRQDPPFDMAYITATYLLEMIADQTMILNNPAQIRNCPEKLFTSEFSEYVPQTIICADITKIQEFRKEQGDVILKPLYSCGGDGIILLKKDDPNLESILAMMVSNYGNLPIIIQQYLPEVSLGDKRVFIVDGEVVGCFNRVAQNSNVRSNLHFGGRATKSSLSEDETKICLKIAAELKKRGLFFVGLDMIGGKVTEINVTSPTGINELKAIEGIQVDKIIIDKIEQKLVNV